MSRSSSTRTPKAAGGSTACSLTAPPATASSSTGRATRPISPTNNRGQVRARCALGRGRLQDAADDAVVEQGGGAEAELGGGVGGPGRVAVHQDRRRLG